MPVYLQALALENYRGIREEQLMHGFQKFNFFIGANNSGKSTVLNFLSRHLPIDKGMKIQEKGLDPLERHGGLSGAAILMSVGYQAQEARDLFFEKHPYLTGSEVEHVVEKLFNYLSFDGVIWLSGKIPYDNRFLDLPYEVDDLYSLVDSYLWPRMHTLIESKGNSTVYPSQTYMNQIKEHYIPAIVTSVKSCLQEKPLPDTKLIPAIRQIGPKDVDFSDFSGNGLIDRLATIQNPDHHHRQDRKIFDRINGFLQTVTDRPAAEIEVPNSKAHVLVHMDGRVLPLSSLGTGIQEVVMIAAFCTLSDNEIICIEEPEIHLHPLLQRKLIRYLQQHTKNQYFIATHSAAFIDTAGAAIFHVMQEDGVTRINRANLNKDRYAICADLGHRASDIIQSNAVVWVEGPSDRIYLKHWISLSNPELVEGVHYSIMFYGGRLLSHLSADDDDVEEFIELRALNRNLAVMIDSDKKSARSPINPTKQRLKTEFGEHGGIAWITHGREVENYIDYDLLQTAVQAVHTRTYDGPANGGKFDNALHFKVKRTKKQAVLAGTKVNANVQVDKVKVARYVVASGKVTLDVLDLKKRVEEITAMIRRANS